MKKLVIFLFLMMCASISWSNPGIDYQALRALYLSTNGDSWANNSGWPDDALFSNPAYETVPPSGFSDLSTWFGINTLPNGCVVNIYLQNNNLDGTIPEEIGLFDDRLLALHLEDNQLSGNIPQEIGNLTQLNNLFLANNQLSGNIPAELGNISTLTDLSLFNNDLTGCYDFNLLFLCSTLTGIHNMNEYISDGNSLDIPWETFCMTGESCPPQVPCPTTDVTVDHNGGCCYELDLNNIGPNPISEIHVDITGPPGVSFNPPSVTPSIIIVFPQQIQINNNGNPIPTGNYVKFCLDNNSGTAVTSQSFEITYFDINGSPIIDCTQQITEGCELLPTESSCIEITDISVECDSLEFGKFKFTYNVVNQTTDYVLDAVDFQVIHPAGDIILSATSNPIVPPVGPGSTSTDQCIDIFDMMPGPYPKQVDIIFTASGYHANDSTVFCCHEPLDTLTIILPDCTPVVNCIDILSHDVYCDSLGNYYLDFCIENNSNPPFIADELIIAKLSSTPTWLGLSQYVWNTNGFPLMNGDLLCRTVQITGFNPPQNGDIMELEFKFNNAQGSCCAEREVLNITLDCGFTPPQCDDCVDRVEVIDYQGTPYIVSWGSTACSDNLTTVYNYYNGVVFCKEGGFQGHTECSDLTPSLIDNHTVQETLWVCDSCCLDYEAFIERVNAPVLTNAPGLGGCDLYLTTTALNDCDQVTIDWGDGLIEGPFPPGNVDIIHTYTSTGAYEVTIYVVEIGADGNACWEEVSSFKVEAECEGKRTNQTPDVVFKNSPNPFTKQTTIEVTLTKDTSVTLLVYDSMGQKIATLLDDEPIIRGTHQVTFDGTNYPSDVYYCTIQAGEFFDTQKMILTK